MQWCNTHLNKVCIALLEDSTAFAQTSTVSRLHNLHIREPKATKLTGAANTHPPLLVAWPRPPSHDHRCPLEHSSYAHVGLKPCCCHLHLLAHLPALSLCCMPCPMHVFSPQHYLLCVQTKGQVAHLCRRPLSLGSMPSLQSATPGWIQIHSCS